MDDLVERLHTYRPTNEWGDGVHHEICDEAAARITELETALAEMTEDRDLWKQSEAVASEQFDKAEGRVIADVVAWLRTKAVKAWGEDTADTYLNEFAATALETGEWKK